jgi:hypothetical protein
MYGNLYLFEGLKSWPLQQHYCSKIKLKKCCFLIHASKKKKFLNKINHSKIPQVKQPCYCENYVSLLQVHYVKPFQYQSDVLAQQNLFSNGQDINFFKNYCNMEIMRHSVFTLLWIIMTLMCFSESTSHTRHIPLRLHDTSRYMVLAYRHTSKH